MDIKLKYFTWEEILAPLKKYGLNENAIPLQMRANIVPTMMVLDKLRDYYGDPIIINSTYRTPEINRQVGGKENSLHLLFNAVDFTVKNKEDLIGLHLTLSSWDRTPNKFSFLPKEVGNFGLGKYPTFLHLDTRSILKKKAPVRW